MTTRIKKLSITGLRGVQKTLELTLSEKSILLYGDNGTGKSSISDSLEWFYKDSVLHLSGSEIDLKEALRNSNLSDADISSVELEFTKSVINSNRTLSSKKGKLNADYSNKSTDFSEYLNKSKSENLILRYQFLTDFIDKTKGDKLKSLSDIIGYAEVNKAKDVLKKSFNSLKTELKTQNYETLINNEKKILIEKINAAVSEEKDLFEKMNEIILPLKLDVEIKSIQDINKVLQLLQAPANTKALSELRFVETCQSTLTTLKSEAALLNKEYENYYTEFKKIADDVQSIMQVFFAELLKAGSTVIEKKYHKDETCPLCLQPKSKEDLLIEIQNRLKQIEESAKKKAAFDSAKQMVNKLASERIKRLEVLRADVHYNDLLNELFKKAIDALVTKLADYEKNGNEKVTSGKMVSESKDLNFSDNDFEILTTITSKITTLQEHLKKDNKAILFSNISSAKDAFLRIKNFEREKEVIEKQKASMEIIYNEFVKKQKQGLEDFIAVSFGMVNEFYQFMNPGEQFQDIRIVVLGEEDNLDGITIEYKYYGNWVSPPQKYFSESHLNCFGLSFFLASVVTFNRQNEFILLDDVISSFDSNHRKRFADLLFEKFSKFQIILLTHEIEWFQYVSQLAKRKGWLINEIKWSDLEGTHIDAEPSELRKQIENDLANGNVSKLGNPMRIYLEGTLKEIAENLEVKVSFRFNDANEKRMADELLNELKSRIKDKSTDLKAQMPVIDRVANSNILGNLLSHNNPFSPKLGDLKAFWADFVELKKYSTAKMLVAKNRLCH
ncbi:MAG: hypothetical protein IPG55_02055 [Saprospiraceae bacterium]|nr:hypothetical protein [Candidatus Defluviibacterium haderslevense]